MKQYYAQLVIRNDWERLHEVYPEVRQMTNNQKGYDHLMENRYGIYVRIEEKWRRKGGKYEVTPAQENIADIFTLRTGDDIEFDRLVEFGQLDRARGLFYHMLSEKYDMLKKIHSAWASGYREKSSELSQKSFIEHSTRDLRSLIDEVKHNFGTLENFFN